MKNEATCFNFIDLIKTGHCLMYLYLYVCELEKKERTNIKKYFDINCQNSEKYSECS